MKISLLDLCCAACWDNIPAAPSPAAGAISPSIYAVGIIDFIFLPVQNMDLKNLKPFRMGVFARSGGGKSYMTFGYALELVKSQFVDVDRVVLISRTWKSDPSQSEFVKYCKKKYPEWVVSNAFEELNDAIELLMGIFQTQK